MFSALTMARVNAPIMHIHTIIHCNVLGGKNSETLGFGGPVDVAAVGRCFGYGNGLVCSNK